MDVMEDHVANKPSGSPTVFIGKGSQMACLALLQSVKDGHLMAVTHVAEFYSIFKITHPRIS